jgi:ubiquinone/menaquinone biosynthesis C-methylase UbiE
MRGRRRFTSQLALAVGGLAWAAPAPGGSMGEQGAGGWQLVEDSAEAYERYLVPALFAAMADRVLDLARVRPGERVLDVGCGTGIVARRAAPRVGGSGRVAGLDLNEGMLRVARRAGAGLTPAIEWRQGDATALPFADGAFDLVTCQQVLQFVPDRGAALRGMRRVLAPGGRAAIAVLRPIRYTPAYVPVADALQRHVGADAGAMMRSPFPSWDREELRALVARGGFREVGVRIEVGSGRYPSAAALLEQEAASSPLAGTLRALAPAAHAALVRDLTAALADFTDDDGVTFPMETFVAVARA